MEPVESPGSALVKRPTYWLTRFIILRLLGIVYAIGFLAARLVELLQRAGWLPEGLEP